MNREYKIRLDKEYVAHGVFSGSVKKPLVIIVHGLGTGITEGLYEQAQRWFTENGYATYLFGLYGWQKDARQLINCTLEIHSADLDKVVEHFRRKGINKIYAVGHSFGGPTILRSKKQRFDAVAVWDPSYDLSFTKKSYGMPGGEYVNQLDGYLMPWGINVLIGRAMAEESDQLDWAAIPKTFHVPLKIIVAGDGVLVSGCQKYFASANKPKQLSVLKGATHFFNDSQKMRERLFKLTSKWFEKF
ncbi:MAG: alpha/beta hydrolase [Parcubacteria group bacterium]|nr:alpha/beta hydrolase [Parcubacteria group bacterium]